MTLRIFGFFLLLWCFQVKAQINHPKASPFSQVEQKIGLSMITVKYSRPAARGREVFGGLVPYGRIWRVGANESTKITVDTEMKIGDHILPQGTYALYAFPEANAWQVVFHTNTSHWGDGRNNYKPEEDLFRLVVVPQRIPYHQENFLISFDSITHTSAHMELAWERTKITIPFQVDTHAQMKKEIAQQIANNPTAQTYYEAARYLQEQERGYETALGYLNNALELGGDTYYFHRVKSLVEAGLGDYAKAITSAKKSLAIADQLGKDEFVRMNQRNIQKWTSLLTKK